MELNLSKVPKMIGATAKQRFTEISTLIENSSWPVYLVGPSGSGKSIMGMNVAKWYASKNSVPAYYVQLSPDQTKTSLILGLRLVNGSLVPVKGLIATAMESGGIVIIDEAAHATQELLLMFNSICDRTSVTAIGDAVVIAKDSFRVIFASNNSTYAGNAKLPQSFAQRMIAFDFNYPSADDEAKIALRIANGEYKGGIDVPLSIAMYVTSIVREFRTATFPLSVRNVASSMIMMQVKKATTSDKPNTAKKEKIINDIGGSQPEAVFRRLYKRLTMKEARSINEIVSDDTFSEFMEFVTTIGVEAFKQSILSSLMYYLDAEGFNMDVKATKEKIFSSIL